MLSADICWTDLQDVLFRLQALHLLLPRQLSTWLYKNTKKLQLQTQQREHGQHCRSLQLFELSPPVTAGAPMVVHQPVDRNVEVYPPPPFLSSRTQFLSHHLRCQNIAWVKRNKQKKHKKTLELDMLHHWIWHAELDLSELWSPVHPFASDHVLWQDGILGPMGTHIILFGHQTKTPDSNVTYDARLWLCFVCLSHDVFLTILVWILFLEPLWCSSLNLLQIGKDWIKGLHQISHFDSTFCSWQSSKNSHS